MGDVRRLMLREGADKKIGSCRLADPFFASLQAGYVRCLQALGAAGDFKFNRLAFVQSDLYPSA